LAESEHSPSPKSRHSSGWSWERLPLNLWGKKGSKLAPRPNLVCHSSLGQLLRSYDRGTVAQ
jgi:hypothetical protein